MKTFIVTGIQMRNKGSQAMFVSLAHSLKSVFGECDVVGFANKYDDPEQYTFRLLPYDDYTRFIIKYRLHKVPFLVAMMTSLVTHIKKNRKWHNKIPEITSLLIKADAIFDASGYTLGSGWPKQSGRILLDTIRISRRYGKKIVLMPQSFGPFDWGERDDLKFADEMRTELAYPVRIFAREREGYDSLVALGLRNVELSADVVIRERCFPSASQIRVQHVDDEESYPTRGSVGLIFNKNLLRFGEASAGIDLYVKMLEKLIARGEKVYVLATSTADAGLVDQVLRKAINGQNIHVISGEYSSSELLNIIARFKFVVASRYHSVVFAYRSGVPAVVLGWASKYSDLAALFQQENYVFDIRNVNLEHLLEGVENMCTNYEDEARIIMKNLEVVQASSVVLQAVRALGEKDRLSMGAVPSGLVPAPTVSHASVVAA